MTEKERACEYLESMAEKAGGDVKVFTNARGAFIMHRKGNPQRTVEVKLDELRESFNRKVRWLMEE